MNNNLTEISIILDRSGSMSMIWDDAIGGLKEFINKQASIADSKANLSLTVFDDVIENPISNVDIAKVNNSVIDEIRPRGSTALYDAIGRTINNLGSKLASILEEKRPTKVIVVIITDGAENASREFTQPVIEEMISHQKAKYSWEFVFLAANQDAMKVGSSIGINNSINYTINNTGALFSKSLNSITSSYRSVGDLQSVDFSAIEKELTK